VPAYSGIAAPLHALAGISVLFRWADKCRHAFRELKEALISSPVLAMPRDGDPFILDTDACNVSIVLYCRIPSCTVPATRRERKSNRVRLSHVKPARAE